MMGIAHGAVIGTRYDRRWIKYVTYALDTALVCALFVLIPVSRSGDGLVAAFNTPLPIDRPADAAVEAGFTLIDMTRSHRFALRIGIASGDIAAGSVGSDRYQTFTVYGRP